MDLGEELGDFALNTFIKPQVNKAVATWVAKDTSKTAAQQATDTAEIEAGVMAAMEIGLEEYMNSKVTANQPPSDEPS